MSSEDLSWADEYISYNEEMDQYICWDERGEYINRAPTREAARYIIDDYVDTHWRKPC